MPLRAGFVAMEAAGSASEGRFGLEDDLIGSQGAKPKRRHRTAKNRHSRRIRPARKMQRGAVVRCHNSGTSQQGIRGHQWQALGL